MKYCLAFCAYGGCPERRFLEIRDVDLVHILENLGLLLAPDHRLGQVGRGARASPGPERQRGEDGRVPRGPGLGDGGRGELPASEVLTVRAVSFLATLLGPTGTVKFLQPHGSVVLVLLLNR